MLAALFTLGLPEGLPTLEAGWWPALTRALALLSLGAALVLACSTSPGVVLSGDDCVRPAATAASSSHARRNLSLSNRPCQCVPKTGRCA